MTCLCKANDFGPWKKIFDQHAESKKITLGEKEVELPYTRAEFCDESQTELYLNADSSSPNEWAIYIDKVDLSKMGAAMGSEAFKEMSDSLGFAMSYGPAILAPPPEGPPPADAPPPNMCGIVEVKDFDIWYSGFMEHSKGKNVKGLELPFSRSEMCDDSKTMVYRSLKNPNKVLMAMFGIQNEVMGKALENANFLKLVDELGEIVATKRMLVMTALPPPPTAQMQDMWLFNHSSTAPTTQVFQVPRRTHGLKLANKAFASHITCYEKEKPIELQTPPRLILIINNHVHSVVSSCESLVI